MTLLQSPGYTRVWDKDTAKDTEGKQDQILRAKEGCWSTNICFTVRSQETTQNERTNELFKSEELAL